VAHAQETSIRNLYKKLAPNRTLLYSELPPDKTDHTYNLRPRCHSFSLTVKTDTRNCINRILLKTFISFLLSLYGCVLSTCFY